MEKIILEGVEFQFNDFSEKMQKKLYLQNETKYREEAAKSQYASMRTLIIVEETDSSKLNKMLRKEVQGQNDRSVKDAIMENPNFKLEEETIEVFADSRDWVERVIAANEETDSSKLNEMLIRELQGKNDDDVKQAIIENSNFRIEEGTIEALANSNYWEDRAMAAKEETDSSRLNEMLRREVKNYHDSDVIKAIKENSNFKLEEETIKVLANSVDWGSRLIVAQSEKTSIEILEAMYKKEKDEEVLEALEDNMEQRVLNKKVQLSICQKQKIRKVLKEFKNSNLSVAKCLEKILEIIG